MSEETKSGVSYVLRYYKVPPKMTLSSPGKKVKVLGSLELLGASLSVDQDQLRSTSPNSGGMRKSSSNSSLTSIDTSSSSGDAQETRNEPIQYKFQLKTKSGKKIVLFSETKKELEKWCNTVQRIPGITLKLTSTDCTSEYCSRETLFEVWNKQQEDALREYGKGQKIKTVVIDIF